MRNFLTRRIATSRRNSEWYLMNSEPQWYVYIVECSDKTLYTGVTNDIDRRLHEHNHTAKGAKYTRSRRPVNLVVYKAMPSKQAAFKTEYLVKKQKKQNKIKYLTEWKNESI